MRLLQATPRDAEALSELDLLLFGEDSFGPSIFRQELTVGWGLLALEGEEIVGYALVRPGRLHDLTRLGVHPRHHRKGIARELLRAARATHPGPMMLFVRKQNAGARALYVSECFRIEGCLETSWLMLSGHIGFEV